MLGEGHAAWKVVGAIALLAAVSVVAWCLRRTSPWIAWGWCWFLGTLVPVIGLVQVGFQALADRYTYVPLVGVFVAVVWSAAEAALRWRVPRVAMYGAFALAATALAGTAAFQVGHWRNSVTLNRHAVQVDESNAVAWAGLGDAYLARGETKAAIDAYRKALSIGPMLSGVQGHLESGLGVEAGRAGRHAEAVAHFERAVATAPEDAVTWFNLGSARGNLGRHAEAAAAFERALALRPTDARSIAGLAIARIQLGDRAGALAAIERLRPLDPARAEGLEEHARRLPR
jgi:Flp pilus assembly protein TadD